MRCPFLRALSAQRQNLTSSFWGPCSLPVGDLPLHLAAPFYSLHGSQTLLSERQISSCGSCCPWGQVWTPRVIYKTFQDQAHCSLQFSSFQALCTPAAPDPPLSLSHGTHSPASSFAYLLPMPGPFPWLPTVYLTTFCRCLLNITSSGKPSLKP